MIEVNKLYPQYNVVKDRRVQKASASPVGFERRSGIERRNDNRIKLDTTLTRDIFEVKNKVSQIKKTEDKNSQGVTFAQNVSRAAQNSIKTDQFVKTAKPNTVQTPKEAAKSKSQTGAVAGLISVVLGGTLLSTVLGVAGVVVAIGIGAFVGGRLLKNAIVSHIKNK